MIAFLLKHWLTFVAAGLVAVIGAQEVRIRHAHAECASFRASVALERQQAAAAALKAEQEAREEEQRREQRKQEIIDAANQETEVAQAAARDAAGAAAGMQQRLAAYVAAVRRATANTTTAERSKGEPDSDALDLLASVLSRVGNGAGELAEYTDRLRVAGLACEQQYDSLSLQPRNQVP